MRKSNQIETKTTQNIEKLNRIVPKILSRLEMAIVEDLWPPQGSRKIHIVHVESPSEIFVRDEIMEDKWSQREEDFKRVRFICFYLPKVRNQISNLVVSFSQPFLEEPDARPFLFILHCTYLLEVSKQSNILFRTHFIHLN